MGDAVTTSSGTMTVERMPRRLSAMAACCCGRIGFWFVSGRNEWLQKWLPFESCRPEGRQLFVDPRTPHDTMQPCSLGSRVQNFKVVAGKDKDNRHDGIYEWNGEQLKICVTTVNGGDRPNEFKTKAGSKRLLVTLKRATR